jgi:hypothetical protein
MQKPLRAIGLLAALLLTSCSADPSKTQIRTYQLGERVQLGPFIYTVFETQWLTQLGEGASARLPQHRFFLVRVSITNAGSTDGFTPPASLVDAKGTTFPELTNGEGVPDWIGSLRQIKPANSAQGNLVFDAPPAQYKLRVADENEQHVGLVDIPLAFETPMAPPGAGGIGEDRNDKKGAFRTPR